MVFQTQRKLLKTFYLSQSKIIKVKKLLFGVLEDLQLIAMMFTMLSVIMNNI